MKNSNRPIVACKAIGKSYGGFLVLKNVSFSIQRGDKVGLVGPNGIGKSTLLKIIAGHEKQDDGILAVTKGVRIGYMPQSSVRTDMTVKAALGDIGTASSIFSALTRLGFSPDIFERKIGELSGGERSKIALARIFAMDQDLLILDEPTNNLDMRALVLLEDYVTKSDKTFIIVSHDRRFLDKAVNRMIEIDERKRDVRQYEGGFSEYALARKLRIESEWKAYRHKVEERGRLKESLAERKERIRNLERTRLANRKIDRKEKEKPDDALLRDKEAKAGRRARVIADRIERFDRDMEEIERPKEFLPLKLAFEVEERSGDKVFDVLGARKELSYRKLGPIDLSVRYGDRILITGPNGEGKTTLLKMILGEIRPDTGIIEKGAKVSIGYLSQEEDLLPDHTVREEFLRHVEIEEGIGRRLLNRFRIEEADVKKKVKDLSFGERSRLIFAILMARKANCLVLDEPSNHLDLEALESLENALKEFKGTLVVVSHDRYFIERIGVSQSFVLESGILKKGM